MGTWIELRCERRGEGRSEFSNTRCYSDDNHGPADMADDTQQSLVATYQFVKQEGIEAGWKLVRGEGWVCPACLAYALESAAEVPKKGGKA
jgi:hypothetical protein